MQCKLICSSHSPLMKMYARAPAEHQQITDLLAHWQEQVHSYHPDLVIVLGCDHFNGFFLNCMPSFCLGAVCEAVDDVGGTPGTLKVTDQAMKYAAQLREKGVDTAVSMNMKVDHGFSQTMQSVMGGLDSYPCLPIFINSIAPPYVPFQRSRILGETLASIVEASSVERLLVIATGGMSHNPTRYYPDPSEAQAEVYHYQMNGPSESGLTHQQWLDRLDTMHQDGAHMLVDGRRTRSDIKMNPPLDKRFAQLLCSDDFSQIDSWDNQSLIAQGGIGFTELHTWVAANGLFRALCPSQQPRFDIYAQTLEYGIGFGAVSGGFNP